METVSFADLAPILATVLGPVLAFAVASMRYQHIDSTKTRDLIEERSRENRDLVEERSRENRDLVEERSRENRDLIDRNRDLIEKCSRENRDLIKQYTRENRDLIEQYSQETIGSLGEVRERLTRIEVRIFPPPSHDDEAEAA